MIDWRWKLKGFFHWWMCKRNPDKEYEWMSNSSYAWLRFNSDGLTTERTFSFPDFYDVEFTPKKPVRRVPLGEEQIDIHPDDPANAYTG